MEPKILGIESQRLASIDIGTNTFRLLIAEVQPDIQKNNYNIKEIQSERIITRLGQGINENGLIKNEAINKSIVVLKKFSEIISHHGVHKTSAVATSALREAKNSGIFLKKVKKTTGLEIKIVSGKEEAEITSSGMLIGITPPESALMIDIGGGSTELIFTNRRKPSFFHSLKLGVVYLADKYMKNDPPLKDELNQIDKEILQKIMLIANPLKKFFSKNTVLIGTAGTITALSAIAQRLNSYNHSKIHNFKITIEKIRGIFSDLSTITARERIKYHPFEPERSDIIVPGALLLIKLMETFSFKEIIVSNYGLREGILLNLYKGK